MAQKNGGHGLSTWNLLESNTWKTYKMIMLAKVRLSLIERDYDWL